VNANGAIKNKQSREIGDMWYTRRSVGNHYIMQAHTNNVNKA